MIGVVFDMNLSWFERWRLGVRVVGFLVGERAKLASHEQTLLATREPPRDSQLQGFATRDEGLSMCGVDLI